jgi:hypothetical protein
MKKFLEILDRLTVVTEKWIERRYPKSEEVDPGEVGIYDSGNPEEPKSKEEYEAFNSPKPGRFETAFADHHPED